MLVIISHTKAFSITAVNNLISVTIDSINRTKGIPSEEEAKRNFLSPLLGASAAMPPINNAARNSPSIGLLGLFKLGFISQICLYWDYRITAILIDRFLLQE